MIKTTARFFSLALLSVSLQAGVITGYSSRASFGGDDTLQWGVAADEGSAPASPFWRTSVGGGITATASLPGDPNFLIVVEGSVGGGNFALGDVLLFTDSSSGPLSIAFDNSIAGVGMQIQRNLFGAFNGIVRVYGAGNTLFDTLNMPGDSNGNADNSAIFMGARSNLTDIVRIELEVTNSNGSLNNALLINYLSLETEAVPEPATIGLTGVVLARVLLKRRRG